MKTNLLAALALSVLAVSAFAADSGTSRTISVLTQPDGTTTTVVEDLGMPNRDVTSLAGKYPDGADVAVTGTVASKDDAGFLLNRRDGQVRSLISDPGDDRVAVGDVITVYGRLKRVPMDLVQVETEAVQDKASGKTYLTMLGHQRTAQLSSPGKSVKLEYHPF